MSYWSERQPPVFSAPDQRTAAIECTPPLPISQFLDAARKRDDHRTRNSILEEWPIVGVRGFGQMPGWGPLTGIFLRSPSADEHRFRYE